MGGDARERIQAILTAGGPDIVVQPVADLRRGTILGVKALAQFSPVPRRLPEAWLAEAWSVGLGLELELASVRRALALLPSLPADVHMISSVSPTTLASPELLALVTAAGGHRVVVELTEHAALEDHLRTKAAIERLRSVGARLAVGDAGADFASFQNMLRLAPEIIELDHSLTDGIEVDPLKGALVGALVTFAGSLGAAICAGGIETLAQLVALQTLGVGAGHGYFLAPPAALPLPVLPEGPWATVRETVDGVMGSSAVTSASRLAALEGTGLLDTLAEEEFDQLSLAASQMLDVPTVLLTLVDGHRQFFKSAVGLAEPYASRREMPLTHSLCKYAMTMPSPLVISDAASHPLSRDSPVTTELGIGAYLGIPLVTMDGHALGAFCAVTPTPHAWSEQDVATMHDLAALAVSWIEVRARAHQREHALSQSTSELARPEERRPSTKREIARPSLAALTARAENAIATATVLRAQARQAILAARALRPPRPRGLAQRFARNTSP